MTSVNNNVAFRAVLAWAPEEDDFYTNATGDRGTCGTPLLSPAAVAASAMAAAKQVGGTGCSHPHTGCAGGSGGSGSPSPFASIHGITPYESFGDADGAGPAPSATPSPAWRLASSTAPAATTVGAGHAPSPIPTTSAAAAAAAAMLRRAPTPTSGSIAPMVVAPATPVDAGNGPAYPNPYHNLQTSSPNNSSHQYQQQNENNRNYYNSNHGAAAIAQSSQPSAPPAAAAGPSFQNLYVSHLPRELGDAGLMALFAGYSPVSARVMLDPRTGRSKGFGFVLFASSHAGKRAHTELMWRRTVGLLQHDIDLFPSVHHGIAAEGGQEQQPSQQASHKGRQQHQQSSAPYMPPMTLQPTQWRDTEDEDALSVAATRAPSHPNPLDADLYQPASARSQSCSIGSPSDEDCFYTTSVEAAAPVAASPLRVSATPQYKQSAPMTTISTTHNADVNNKSRGSGSTSKPAVSIGWWGMQPPVIVPASTSNALLGRWYHHDPYTAHPPQKR